MLYPFYMSIKVKSTAVAIATVSSVLSFSVPPQASEYEYLDESEKRVESLSEQEGVNEYSDTLSVGEYEYLDELEKMVESLSEKEGVNEYSDALSVSEKLKYGKWHCGFLENRPTKDLHSSLANMGVKMRQQGYSDQQINDYITFMISMLFASVKELCPEYKYKVDIVN